MYTCGYEAALRRIALAAAAAVMYLIARDAWKVTR